MKERKGITLIALVITIVILLILAGVAINQLTGENGILKNVQTSRDKHSLEQAREKLKLVLLELQTDKQTKSEYNENDYINNKLDENYMLVEDDIVIVDEWQFEIDRSIPEISQELGKLTKEALLRPRITNMQSTVIKDTAKIDIELKDATGVKIKYIIQKEGQQEIIEETEELQDLSYTFNNLEISTTYIITVEATNEYGTIKRKATIKTISLSELTSGKATFEINPNTKWQKEVTAKIESSYSEENTILQYKIGSDGEWTEYTGEFTVSENVTLYGRYYYTISGEIGYAFTLDVDVIDSEGPVIKIVSQEVSYNSIELIISCEDDGVGLKASPTYEWYKSIDGENWVKNTSATGTSCKFTSLTANTKYFIKVITKDDADNEAEFIQEISTREQILVSKITLDKTSATLGALETLQLNATIEPDNADNKTLKWTSSSTSIAKVNSSTGLVTPVKAGTVTITCRPADGGDAEATCEITIFNGTLIYTREDLENISIDTTASYTLMNDIDLSGKNWTPIDIFTGTLDGNGYTIKNMTIKDTATSKVGFFREVEGAATIKNIKFDNFNVSASASNVGVIAGYADGGISVLDVQLNNIGIGLGSVSGKGYVGSIIGGFYGSAASDIVTFSNCYSHAAISASSTYSGGIVARSASGLSRQDAFY